MDTPDPRDPILDAAERAFADAGLAGARVASITEEAGVNKAMLYYYFGSKHGLYVAVLERLFDQVVAMAHDRLDHAEGPDDIERFIAGYRDILRSHPHFARLMMRELLDGGPNLATILPPRLGTVLPLLQAVMVQGQADGRVNPDLHPTLAVPVMLAPFVFFALVHPLLALVTGMPAGELRPAFDATAAELLLRGLHPRTDP